MLKHSLRPSMIAAAWLLAGCGGDPLGRHAISGTVNVDGAPLAKGSIAFEAMESKSTPSGAVISDGKYSIPRDKGLAPGKYRVVVNAAVPGPAGRVDVEAQPGAPPPPPKEMIPAEWNVASEHTIEVKKEGPFMFPFEISTKGK